MDLEHLNKTQIILLTLLISFVTSIATGIVTVSLLAQAPPAVTQTINRIVERTIEKAVPTPAGSVKETTVVVKEDDLVTDSIAKNAKSIVRVKRLVTLDSGDTAEKVIGIGIVLTKEGLFATDAGILESGVSYSAAASDGSVFSVKVTSLNASYPTALGMLVTNEATKGYVFAPATLGDPKSLKLGQTMLVLSGATRQNVSTGIVDSLITADADTATSTANKQIAFISTNIPGSSLLPGSPLINIFGEVVGISTLDSRRRDASVFTPSVVISTQIQAKQKTTDAAEGIPSPASQSAAVGNSSQ